MRAITRRSPIARERGAFRLRRPRAAGGPFTFDFELTTRGGEVALAGPPSTAAGVTMTLRELTVSASAVRGTLVPEPKPLADHPRAEIVVRLGSRTFPIGPTDESVEGDTLVVTFWTVEGTDTPSSGSIEVTGLDSRATPVPGERWIVPFTVAGGNR